MKRALLPLLLSTLAMPCDAQMSHIDAQSPEATALIDKARQATEIFADRSVAIARGYRLVGRDLPMMGEHWLNVRLLVDGVVGEFRVEAALIFAGRRR